MKKLMLLVLAIAPFMASAADTKPSVADLKQSLLDVYIKVFDIKVRDEEFELRMTFGAQAYFNPDLNKLSYAELAEAQKTNQAAYKALGETSSAIYKQLLDNPEFTRDDSTLAAQDLYMGLHAKHKKVLEHSMDVIHYHNRLLQMGNVPDKADYEEFFFSKLNAYNVVRASQFTTKNL